MAKQNNDAQALDYCMNMIDSKWKSIILYHVNKGTNRFNKLFAEIQGINRQMLSKQLKSLERTGILDRTLYGEIPPRVEYTLTLLGKSLLPVVKAMTGWGRKQIVETVAIPEVKEIKEVLEVKEVPEIQELLEVKETPEVPQNQQLPLF